MPSHRKVNACDVEIAKLGLAAVVNIKSLDGDKTLAILGEADMIDSFNLQDAHAILFDAGFFGKIADGFSNEGGSDFDSGCGVVEEHLIGLVDGERVAWGSNPRKIFLLFFQKKKCCAFLAFCLTGVSHNAYCYIRNSLIFNDLRGRGGRAFITR